MSNNEIIRKNLPEISQNNYIGNLVETETGIKDNTKSSLNNEFNESIKAISLNNEVKNPRGINSNQDRKANYKCLNKYKNIRLNKKKIKFSDSDDEIEDNMNKEKYKKKQLIVNFKERIRMKI